WSSDVCSSDLILALDRRVIGFALRFDVLFERCLFAMPPGDESIAERTPGDSAPVKIAHHIEDGGADRRIAARFHDALPRLRRGEGFIRGAEARADEDSVRAKRDCGFITAPVGDAASR